MDDFKIPSANIDDVDVDAIALKSLGDAEEIRSLGALLDTGNETDNDLVRLCELLFRYGELCASERLLRCNAVVEEGIIRQAYTRMFGHTAEAELDAAINEFARQFQVTLWPKDINNFLKKEYSTRPNAPFEHSDSSIHRLLEHPCVVTFNYEPNGSTADITCDAPDLYNDYLLLKYFGGEWK